MIVEMNLHVYSEEVEPFCADIRRELLVQPGHGGDPQHILPVLCFVDARINDITQYLTSLYHN